jgi:glutamine amidotransferase
MTVAIVDYGSGNLRSAAKAIERAARETGADDRVLVTSNPREVADADRIVLPGVGAFADCRAGLYGVPGMVDTLQRAVIEQGKPFLGICVGMQLMATRGVEYGIHAGLDWIQGDVVRIDPGKGPSENPAHGLERARCAEAARLARRHRPRDHAYFVHSFQLKASRPETVLALTDYGGPITAVVGRDNLAGTQFHPEKSQATGLKLIANFLRWKP